MPLNVNYRQGLNQDQINSIQNLWSNNPVDSWNENDWSNWNYATNNASVPTQNFPTPTPQPVAETPRTPRFPDFNPSSTLDDFYNNMWKTSQSPINEADVRRRMLEQVQGQLDSINSIYDNILANVKVQGANRLGQTRAISARKGTIGSEIGTANKTGTESYNAQAEQAVQAERANKLAAVMDRANSRADEELRIQREQKTADANKYIEYLAGKKDEAKNDIKSLASTGLTLDQISNEEYLGLLKDSGFKTETEFEAFYNAFLPKAQQVKYEYKELKDGTILRYGDDGSYKTLDEFKLPPEGDWTITQLADGTVVAYDKNQAGGEDGNFNFKKIGNFAKPKAVGPSNTLKLTSTQKSKLARLFNSQEISDLESAINALGVEGVLANVQDSQEKKLIQSVFGTIQDTETSVNDNLLKQLGYTTSNISSYKQAVSQGQTIDDPIKFLQDLKASEGGYNLDDWLNMSNN